MPTQTVLASDTFGVTGTLSLGTHLVGKHDVVSATPTPPSRFRIARGPPLFPLFPRSSRGRGLLALLAPRGLHFHFGDHLGHCTAIAAAVAFAVAPASLWLLGGRDRERGSGWK